MSHEQAHKPRDSEDILTSFLSEKYLIIAAINNTSTKKTNTINDITTAMCRDHVSLSFSVLGAAVTVASTRYIQRLFSAWL